MLIFSGHVQGVILLAYNGFACYVFLMDKFLDNNMVYLPCTFFLNKVYVFAKKGLTLCS